MSKSSYIYLNFGRKDLGFFRYAGPGLCNLLFVWARGIVAAEKYSLRLLSPTWVNIKPGAIFRGENDKRFYNGLFIQEQNNIAGIKKIYLQYALPHLDEEVLYKENEVRPGHVYVFSGLKNYFEPFANQYKFIRQKLDVITCAKHKIIFDFSGSVSVHIRLGDFKVSNSQTSILWFKEKLLQLREAIKKDMPCYIFSDGNEDELSDLLQLPDVKKIFFGSSIADMIALSQSNILLGSNSSTFSMWAAFLGRMPTIWPIKDRLVEEMGSSDVHWIFSEKGANLPDNLIDYLRRKSNEMR